ncbi:MAG: DUF11 domain-containing protein [Chloroflexota bacterium]|nr:DUF11 domain-containing protein [Chloroflexota bacterium]
MIIGDRRARALMLALALVLGTLLGAAPARSSTVWTAGDIFAGVGGGQYNVYTNAGTFKETITDGSAGFTTGCAFNPALDKLYTTSFSAGNVVVYNDPSPHAIAQTIPSRPSPESVVFASNGHFFVGGPADSHIEEYDAAGTLVHADAVSADGTGGPDWIDLAADQATMFYASEGREIRRFNVQTDTQLATFATLPGSDNAYALRLLPPGDGTGGLLVADRTEIKRLDGSGAVVLTYDAAGQNGWFSLNLDPNGTSFWAGDFNTNNFYRFNIASGAIEIGPINTGGTLFGLCLKGEPTAGIPSGADLAITSFTDAPDPVTATKPIRYTTDLTNFGPDPATNVSVTQVLPAGSGFLGASDPSCAETGGQVDCSLGTLAADASRTLTIDVAAPSTPGTAVSTVSVSATEPDPHTENNSASATTQVQSPSAAPDDASGFATGQGSTTISTSSSDPVQFSRITVPPGVVGEVVLHEENEAVCSLVVPGVRCIGERLDLHAPSSSPNNPLVLELLVGKAAAGRVNPKLFLYHRADNAPTYQLVPSCVKKSRVANPAPSCVSSIKNVKINGVAYLDFTVYTAVNGSWRPGSPK